MEDTILSILKKSDTPLGPSDITRHILKKDYKDPEFANKKAKIHYNLQKLEEEGRVKSLDGKYALTPQEFSKRGICHVCREEIVDSDDVLSGFSRNPKQKHKWLTALIHKKCFPKSSDIVDVIWGEAGDEFFCNHCGLPISPNVLAARPIYYKLIASSLLKFEKDTIDLVSDLQKHVKELHKSPKSFEEWVNCGQEVEALYNESNFEIPKWIVEGIKEDKGNVDESFHGVIVNKILNHLISFEYIDLSSLSDVENFFEIVMKYRAKLPDDYNMKQRIQEVWSAAQKLSGENKKQINRMYEKLLGPSGTVYTGITPDWVTNPVPEEWGDPDVPNIAVGSAVLSQTLAFKDGEKLYHPYCAEELGIKEKLRR